LYRRVVSGGVDIPDRELNDNGVILPEKEPEKGLSDSCEILALMTSWALL